MSYLPYKVTALARSDNGDLNIIPLASVLILTSSGVPATLREADLTTPIPNPFNCDENGEREAWIRGGSYTISVEGGQSWDIRLSGASDIQSVATIADLATISGEQNGKIIIASEYHNGTGIGGGIYRWDSSAQSSEHNGGTIISPGAPYPQDWSVTAEVSAWFDYSSPDAGCWTLIDKKTVSIEQFGYRSGLVVDVQAVVFEAAANACKHGGTLDVKNYEYDFGYVDQATWKVSIDSPSGMTIIGQNALIKCRAVGGRASIIGVRNPQGFQSIGVSFNDPDFDIAASVGGGSLRVGCYGYLIYANSPYTETSPCGDVLIRGDAINCMGLVSFDASTQLGVTGGVIRGVKGVEVKSNCTTSYYGVSNVYGATDFDLDVHCTDVRRAFINYGGHTGKVRSTLNCSAGFIGSNAYIEMACESTTLGDVYDFDIDLTVTGVEAHESLVTLYHQQDGNVGEIRGIRSFVLCDNLTTAGKNPDLGNLHIYRLVHEQTNGTIRSPTTRVFGGLSLESSVIGGISGVPILVQSAPSVKTGKLATSSETNDLLPNFGLWLDFKVLSGAKTQTFSPLAIGSTTAGTGTYTNQKGVCSVVDGHARCSISLAWTGHTGTGPLKIGPLPVPGVTSATIGNPSISVVAHGFGPANGILSGALTGAMQEISIYSTDITSRAITAVTVPASGTITLDISYPLYI